MRKKLFTVRRPVAASAVVALVASGAAAVLVAPPASAVAPSGVSPVVQRPADNVTADALPTTQVDGVVWSQQIVGDTVYAGGEFKNARPAGAAAGTQLTPRANLLAYSLSTGNLITSFAPSLNAQVKTVAVSPDKSRVYVGGSFTQANGVNRYRIAAYSTSTGVLVTTFAPAINATVSAIRVTSTAVFVAGAFTSVGGTARSRLAAFDPNNGALLSWAPSADATVNSMELSPSKTKVVVGGSFQNINGAPAYGLGAIDLSGALVPWAANQVVRDAGPSAAILDLSTDGTNIYSSSYVYGSGGNFEGNAAMDGETGQIKWLADCHGDTYGTYASGGVVYSVGHQHFCSNIGGFPDTNPRNRWYRTTAFTHDATGTVRPNGQAGGGYGNFAGQPSPSLINWVPTLTAGSYTGQVQAAWSVTGNGRYVVEGGEFPKVNGVAQQGLVRFAIPSVAPKKQGPLLSAGAMNTTVLPLSGNSVRVTWKSNTDRDDMNLTYTLTRNGVTIYTKTIPSLDWVPQTLGFVDNTTQPGQTYTYRVRVSDQDGNAPAGNNVTVTTPSGTATTSAYMQDVLDAGASHYWRLDQGAGVTTDFDRAGFSDLTLNSGVAAGAPGAIVDDGTGSSFNGSTSGFGATSDLAPGPDVFSVSGWFATTSTAGGKIVSFGDKNTGTSSNYDRHLYMSPDGRINFGVYNNASYIITSPNRYNDGQYHQVVGTLDDTGMRLYVDGKLIGTNSGTTMGQPYSGYWRVGGDSAWNGAPFFAGNIDDVAVYPTALTLAQIRKQYVDSGRSLDGGTAPADAYGSAVWNDQPSLYYRLDDTSGTAAADRSGNGSPGTYLGSYSQGTASPVSGTSGTAVTFDGSGSIASNTSYPNPTQYSTEVWFKTTSTSGGKLIGFGNSNTGTSSSYDRHVYMLGDGRLVFGTYTGQLNLATSANAYNDGKWHQAVATQGPAGMVLYVDGASVATNPQTSAEGYTGYWRVGGDNLNGWGANGYFSGVLDEAAVYPFPLTAAQVKSHYSASPASSNAVPTASFTNENSGASVTFDASASSDPDGTIASYAWDFGDGGTSTDPNPTHAYGGSGNYHVTLTVTDNRGTTAQASRDISVTVPVNQAPTAAFTATPTNLSVAFDASASTDDGTIASYTWDFGDGNTGVGVQPTHAYSAGGTYNVTLTVADEAAQTGTKTVPVTVSPAPNQAPTPAFTATPTERTVAFDASASTDTDGTIASYAWDFGDGTSGTGATTSRTYTADGTYTVTLTVTDNDGATRSISKPVTVAGVLASDAFGRTATGAWGNADAGGAWTLSSGASSFSVGNGVGKVRLGAANAGPLAMLNGVSVQNVDQTVELSLDQVPTGNGASVTLLARRTSAGDYRVRLKLLADGTLQLAWSKVVAGKETVGGQVAVRGVTYAAGDVLKLRFRVSGDGTTSTINGRVWKAGTDEPTAWNVTGTDATPEVQGAGAIGVLTNLGSTATNAPVVVSYDNYQARRL